MKKILLLIAVLLGSQFAVYAQPTPTAFSLEYSDDTPQPWGTPSSLGEFRFSLGSQIFSLDSDFLAKRRIFSSNSETKTGALILRNSDWQSLSLQNTQGNFRGLRRELSDFESTLTLTPDYLQEERSVYNSKREGIFGRRRIGKLDVYGEMTKEDVPTIVKSETKPVNSDISQSKLSANIQARSDTKKNSVISKPLDIAETADGKTPSLTLNNYYLEAIYNFKPSLQGKVSYKRSTVDSLDRNEKLQVEGIVEAGKDVVIKAGYKNETKPEISNDKKPTNDTKVWTEFILKF